MRLRHALTTMGVTALLLGVPTTLAAAQEPYPGGTTPSTVAGESEDRPDEVLGTTAGRAEPAATAGAGQTLPVTGGDLVGLAAIGAGLVGVGTVVVRRSRRTGDTVASA